jgi:hypothetical protein
MASVSSDVTVRDTRLLPGGEREENCEVRDLLIYTANSPSLLLVINSNYSMKAFDVDTWRCVSHCVLDSHPVCMYEISGSVYIHCNDRRLYHVTSTSPLSVTRHGQTGAVYGDIAALDDNRLVAVCPSPPCLHVIGHRGDLLADLTEACTGYGVSRPWRITHHSGLVIVLDWGTRRVVCMGVSPDNHPTHIWRSEVLGNPRDVVVTAGVILVTCDPATVITLDMESGRELCRVELTRGTDLYLGLSVDAATSRLYAGMGWLGVAELHLQGKL